MRRFHRGFLITGLLLTGLAILGSLLLFPEWSAPLRLVIILLVIAIGGAATYLASTGQGLENLPPVQWGGEPPLSAGDFVKGAAPGLSPLHQLRAPVAGFTGRELEIVQLLTALQLGHAAAISIDGLPGVGKTELAYAVARRLVDTFPDAQLVVDMRGAPDTPHTPASAMALIVNAFQPELRLPDDLDQLQPYYRSLLNDKRVLLLLDNAVDAAQIQPLLPPPSCALLVTSRQRIDLPGIARAGLDALPMPRACELLIELIGPQRATAEQFTRLARLCGGLPLALRVAGSFLAVHRDWPVEEYLNVLHDERTRLGRLKQDDLDVEAVLSASYTRLQRDQPVLARMWRLLAVFPTSFNRLAAAAVWQTGVAVARDALNALVDRSLLLFDAESGRYRLHDLLRLYAAAHLSDGERADAFLQHAAYYLHVLRAADALYLQGGEGVTRGLALFDQERDNIEAGQKWSAAQAEVDDNAARICTAYPVDGVVCLNLRLDPRRQIRWLEAALASARRLNDRRGEAGALVDLGIASYALGDARRAIEFYEQHLVIAREVGASSRSEAERMAARQGEAAALVNLGLAYAALGETRRAVEFYQQQLLIAREISAASRSESERTAARRGEANALGNLGLAHARLGDARRAIEFHEQALVVDRQIGDRLGEGADLGNLGNACYALGEIRRAIEFYEQALVVDREVSAASRGEAERIAARQAEGQDLGSLGDAYAGLGETRRAIQFYEQSLAVRRAIGDRRGEAHTLFDISLALDSLGEPERAIPLAQSALTIFEQLQDPKAALVRRQLAEWRGQ